MLLLLSSSVVSGSPLFEGSLEDEAADPPFVMPEAATGSDPDPVSDLESTYHALDGMVPREDLEACLAKDACRSRLQWVVWTETAPLDHLETALVSQAPGPVDQGLPTPPKLPDYPGMDDAGKREMWRAWYLLMLYLDSRPEGLPDGLFGAFSEAHGFPAAAADEHDGSTDSPEGPGPARDLRGLWRLEGHGVPLEVLPGSGEGDSYLLTTQGLMHFPQPGERPDWMVRTTSSVMKAEPVFASGGELEKIVIGTYPSFDSSDPSIVVLDPQGNEIASGLKGPERMTTWSLTDVDGDGEDDLIGRDSWGRAVAAKLDGTEIYREVIEGPPSTGIVSVPAVPVYLGLIYMRMGMSPFGDIDGDGTLDFVVSGSYWTLNMLLSSTYTPIVQAYSGKDLQELWVHVEPPSDFFSWVFVLGAGDITGDGLADVLTDFTRYNTAFPLPGFVYSYGTLVLAGEDGTDLVRDQQTTPCLALCAPPVGLDDYEALGLLDLDGDGLHDLVGLELTYGSDEVEALDLVIREPGLVPGGPSQEVERHTVSLSGEGTILDGDLRLRPAPGGGQALWIDVLYAKEEGETRVITSEHHVLQAGGLTSQQAQQGLGLVDQDPSTGQFYGWRVDGDRWVALDDELAAQGEGIGLVVDVYPIIYHDVDGDRVEDALVRMSIGYRWVSGRSGEHLGNVDSPAGNRLSRVGWQDNDPVLLEYDPFDRVYTLYTMDRESLWSLEPDGFSLYSLADVTGDGLLEVFVRESGTVRFTEEGVEFEPGSVLLVKMPEEETIWTSEFDWADFLITQELLPRRAGMEILLGLRDDDYWDLELSAHIPENEEELWTVDREETQLRAVGAGTIVIAQNQWNHEDADRLEFLESGTGKTAFEYTVPQHPGESWSRSPSSYRLVDISGNGTADLVYSYRDSDWQAERFEQTLIVLDLAAGKKTMEYRLFDPDLVDFGGWWLVRGSSITGDVGDWDRDGMTDLRLHEHGVPLVRSSADGEVLAVAPKGSFVTSIDLNGDSRKEVALLQPGRLRMMMYAAGAGEIEEGNGTVVRVDNPDQVYRTEEGAEDAFDSNRLPAPAVPLLLVFLGALLAFGGRHRRR